MSKRIKLYFECLPVIKSKHVHYDPHFECELDSAGGAYKIKSTEILKFTFPF